MFASGWFFYVLSGEAPLKSLSNAASEVRDGTTINVLPNQARDGIATLSAMTINTVRRISYLGEEDWRPDESDAMDPRQTRQQL